MNLDQLNETLLSHKSIISGLNTNTALDIEKQDLSLQKEIINWFAKDGILKLHLYVASKSTEKSFVHFILEKGMIESNIGMAYLPPLRKPSSRKNKTGLALLFQDIINDIISPKESEKLQRNNKSMILHSLPLFQKEQIIIVNGYNQKTIPEAFDSVEKCLLELDLKQYEKFIVS